MPLYTTEGGWLHLETGRWSRTRCAAQAQGFGGCKVKVGRPLHEDVARLAAVRAAVGDGFEIFIDANQAFAVDEAIRRARPYEPLDLGWFEEPLPADDLGGHVRLARRRPRCPIAVGESLYSQLHFREYLQRGACSIVQVDVARIGGITPWLKTAHLAEAFNVPVCPHFLMELHVACAAPCRTRAGSSTSRSSTDHDGTHADRGRPRRAVGEPGLGIAWDLDAIKARRTEGASADLHHRA